MLPLLIAESGKELKIAKCNLNGSLKRHTESLGILPGESITLVSKNNSNIIVKVKECRFGIQIGIASQIYVLP